MLDLVSSEILKPRASEPPARMTDKELPAFLGKLDAYEGDPNTVQALRLLMLTATRPGEVRGARWAEFDLDAALWIIPAERMKMRAEHRVPLSRQAVEVLRSMRPLSGGARAGVSQPGLSQQDPERKHLQRGAGAHGLQRHGNGPRIQILVFDRGQRMRLES